MKNAASVTIALVAVAQFCAQSVSAATPPPMLVASYNKNAAYIIDEAGKVLWECKVPGACQDAWLLADGNVLLSGGNQVKVVRPDKSIVWEYTSPSGVAVEIHNCQPLSDGRTVIGEGGTGRILELDANGKIVKEIKLSLGGGAHGEFRQVRKTRQGGYVFCNKGPQILFETDADGKTLRRISAEDMAKQGVKWGALHSAELLPTGNLLVGGGYESPVVEIAPEGKIVWKLASEDVPELGFSYSAGLLRLPNGDTVVAAYNSKVKVFEVTKDKTVVWKYDNPEIGNPTHVKILKPDDLEPFRAHGAGSEASRP